jgi:hypothetical protein
MWVIDHSFRWPVAGRIKLNPAAVFFEQVARNQCDSYRLALVAWLAAHASLNVSMLEC